jgi:glycine/D-amino acid oxidase-like deaminating enzyme
MRGFSYWESKYFWQPATFAIVGSGITGLTTSIYLKKKQPQARVVILERGVLPSGASTKNAGFACFGSLSEIKDDLTHHSEDAVYDLIENRIRGLSMLHGLLSKSQTGYEACGGFEIFTPDEADLFQACKASMDEVNDALEKRLGIRPFGLANDQIKKMGFGNVSDMINNKEEGLIDTGSMMQQLILLARNLGVEILTGVEIQEVVKKGNLMSLQCDRGEFLAEKVCVATNGFAERLLEDVDVKPCRAQVLVTSVIPGIKLQGAFHHHYGYDYFRHVHGRVLIGGGRHLDKAAEQTDEFGVTENIQMYLEKLLREVILPSQSFQVEMRWSGIMGIGQSKELIIKEIEPDLFCAVRFGGMGVALGTAAGHQAAQLMLSRV